MAEQLRFDLPIAVSRAAADFFVSDANADAFAMVTGEQVWPQGKLALIGPQGSGKSHLARVWQGQSGADIVSAASFPSDIALPPNAALIVEDMERLPHKGEEPLFHLHNNLAATGGRLLLTSTVPPSRWPIALPDLASRMQATAIIRLGDPDDRLLGAVLTKLFTDRQLSPAPDIIAMLVTRIERSFAAAAQVVADLDAASLAEGREINRTLLRSVLDKLPPEAR